MTIRVTASFGSFSLRPACDLRETRFLPKRLDAALFALRLVIMAGIVLQPAKTARGSCTPGPGSLPGTKALFLGELAASVQAIKIENGVEHHGVGAARLAAVNRIDRKKNHVAFAGGRVHNGGMLRDFVSTLNQSGNEQILLVGITEDYARAVRRRNHAKAVTSLLVGHGWRFPDLGGKFLGSFCWGAAHGKIRIIRGAAAGGASMRFVAEAAASARASDAAKGKDRPVVAISSDFLVVTISNGAAAVHQSRA